jgi:hypothetical protein
MRVKSPLLNHRSRSVEARNFNTICLCDRNNIFPITRITRITSVVASVVSGQWTRLISSFEPRY